MLLLVVVVRVWVRVRVWVALVLELLLLLLGHRGGGGGSHVHVVGVGVAMQAGGGGGSGQMRWRSGRSSARRCCRCRYRRLLVMERHMTVVRVVAMGVVGGVYVVGMGVDMGGSSGGGDMMMVAQKRCGGRSRRRNLVHVQGSLLVLRLGSSQSRLQGHHPLAVRGQAALLAGAVAVLAVPLVTLQRDLQAVIAAAGAVGRRSGRDRAAAGARGSAAHVVLRVDHVRVGHGVAVPVLLRNHVCRFLCPF